MRFLGPWGGWCAAMVLLATGCGDDDEHATGELPICDPSSSRCQRDIFEATAQIRGQSGEALPQVRTATPEELEPELRELFAEEQTPADAQWARALQELGLLPPGEPLVDVSVAEFLANVAAYYDPDDKRITVIDRAGQTDRLDAAYILSHEFVHALQDRDVDLDAFRRAWVTSTDSSVAITSLVEGEAMVLSTALLARTNDITPERLDWDGFADRLLLSALNGVRVGAPLISAAEILPYPIGMTYLVDAWLDSGQDAIDAVYADPPTAVIDWVHGTALAPAALAEPLDCHPTGAPAGYTPAHSDSLGFTGLYALYASLGDFADGFLRVQAIRGDSIVLFTADGEPPETAAVAAAWRIRTDTAGAAQAVERLVADSVMASAIAVEVDGADVVLRVATDPLVLTAWDTAGCGRAEDLPGGGDDRPAMAAVHPWKLRALPASLASAGAANAARAPAHK